MDMWTVLAPTGRIVCRSRLYDVAVTYLTPGLVLLRNGEPVALELAA